MPRQRPGKRQREIKRAQDQQALNKLNERIHGERNTTEKANRVEKHTLAARLVRQDDGTINFAKVCEKMVRLGPRITPIHKVLVGTVPIIVRGLGNLADDPKTRKLGPPEQLIKDLSLAKVVNAQPEAEPEDVQKVQVLCTISVAEDIDQLGLDELSKWIQGLEMKFSMTVECLFAGSSVVVACMPYHLWSRLQGIPGFGLICVVTTSFGR
jgi:hypothetical protein